MTIDRILQNLDIAIKQLMEKEHDILTRGLNELNLNGHLTKYLTPLFKEYEVDPEYNGDKLNDNDRKALSIAKSRMREIKITPEESDKYELTPDIIIHERNTNKNNLVVLEIKKDTNSTHNKQWDLLKLEHLTIDYLGNRYNYKLGVALILGTKKQAGTYEVKYFQNGMIINRENLK